MNKIAQSLIAATATIVLLAGCSAGSAEAQDVAEPSATPSASVEPSEPAGPVTVTPSEPAAKSGEVADGEALFVKAMHGEVANQGLEGVSDADLLRAGHYACELFAQGQTYDKMVVIQGVPADSAARNNRDIASVASQSLCTEYDISK